MAKPKTAALPGMERKGIKEIETLAEDYADYRDERMTLLEKEVGAKQRLIEVMKKHGQTTYQFEDDGHVVTVELKSGDDVIKVKRKDRDKDED